MKKSILTLFCASLAFASHGQADPTADLTKTVQILDTYAYRDRPTQASDAFDSRIAGKTAGSGNIDMFYYTAVAGTAYQSRNPNIWCQNLLPDLTCFSPHNTQQDNFQGGTLITPRHVLFAQHFSGSSTVTGNPGTNPLQPGTVIDFVGTDNVVYSRRLVDTPVVIRDANGNVTDLCLGTLQARQGYNEPDDLPAAVSPAIILGGGLPANWLPPGSPVLYTGQRKQAHIAQITDFGTRSIAPATLDRYVPWTTPGDGPGPAYNGDSGSPIFVLLNDRAYLWQLFYAAYGYGNSIGDLAPQISAMLPQGYVLNVANLPKTTAGTTVKADLGIYPGNVPAVGSNSYLPPQVLDPRGNVLIQQWDGKNDVTLTNYVTVFANTALNTTPHTITLPTPNAIRVVTLALAVPPPGGTITVKAGGTTLLQLPNVAGQTGQLRYYTAFTTLTSWVLNAGALYQGDAPTAGTSPGQAPVIQANGYLLPSVINPAENVARQNVFGTNPVTLATTADTLVVADSVASARQITLPRQDVRSRAVDVLLTVPPAGGSVEFVTDAGASVLKVSSIPGLTGQGRYYRLFWLDTAWYGGATLLYQGDPLLSPDLGSLPATVTNGQIVQASGHAYMGIGGAWKQLDN